MMIYRLLRDLDPDDYCLISRQNYDADVYVDNYSGRLFGRYYHLPPQFQVTQGRRSSLARRLKRINILRVFLLGKQIAAILKRESCNAVVACTGALLDPPAGYLASRLAGIPFYPYLFDSYSHQWVNRVDRFFAQLLEPILLRGSAGIIVPNEFLRDELRRRYGVEATVIHNPCDIAEYEAIPDDTPDRNTEDISIVYTGAVYAAQYDAMRNLLAAIKLLEQPNVRLHIYTAQSPHELEEKGISGSIVFHEHQPVSAMPSIQRKADLLFLPLAFTSSFPKVIRTSAPGKMGEYLAARRPILVHAPSDSFVVWYFRQHECGLVVDRSDPAELAQAIERLVTDADLRRELCARAWERAQSDFDSSVARSRFAELMKLASSDHLVSTETLSG